MRWRRSVRAVPGVIARRADRRGPGDGHRERRRRRRARARHARASDLASIASRGGQSVAAARCTRFGATTRVIIGERLADKLGSRPAMTITLIAPRGNVTPFGVTPRIKTYHASPARSGSACRDYDSSYIFMPLEEAQLYFNYGRHGQRRSR